MRLLSILTTLLILTFETATIANSLTLGDAIDAKIDRRQIHRYDLNRLAEQEGGGWSGNGGGSLAQDNIWFLGSDRTVRYCIERAPQYPISRLRLRVMVRKSIDQWLGFLNRYHLGQAQIDRLISLNAPAMTLKFEQEACQETTDLVFLFGVSNQLIDSYRYLQSEDGLGLAIRRSYNHETRWNPGYIWIDSFSTQAEKVHHLLLHELGHVFGLKHDSVFVMGNHIDARLRSDYFDGPYFGRIESEAWPFDLRMNEERILSSSLGIKEHILPFRECDVWSISSQSIPKVLRDTLHLQPQSCYKITLRKTDRQDQLHSFKLAFINQTSNKRLEFSGSFTDTKVETGHPGPGVYSHWAASSAAKAFEGDVWAYVPFTKGLQQRRKNGCFIVSTQQCIPASINFSRGLSLDMFDGKSQWWSLNTPELRLLEAKKQAPF
ncbi:hypothetical protein [Pseudobacteriovorax antillogorgiicola]|uniref:Matrixin n=1 Tax=Pseudobacteriovorax antillogorgiicola TaxID=1513793 RepID=A0A1Y6C3U1_9BACT|nr:hypothetical protein [Pseudobacteriovorax antillogorgiicola]TCS50208.1 hypothetical protein EDD56_11326 [Pseudobacteriovorax antillogorgiicola]SMF32334.1 hypothetical protein SAMN06296036_11025 [Pseudobacteriovorax antillogorgiicola]